MEYASKGVAGAGLGTGIAGLSLGVLNSGLLNNGLGGIFGNNGCSENMGVNRYELNMQKEIINRDAEIAYLKGRDAAKTDSLELYRYIDGKFACVERELADQRTYNAVKGRKANTFCTTPGKKDIGINFPVKKFSIAFLMMVIPKI